MCKRLILGKSRLCWEGRLEDGSVRAGRKRLRRQKTDAGAWDTNSGGRRDSTASFTALPRASSVYARQEGTVIRGRRWQIWEGNVLGWG